MDIQIHTPPLQKALERILLAKEQMGFAESSNTVHLHAEGSILSLSISDGSRWLTLRVAGRVVRPGEVLLPLERLAAMVARLPATAIRLEVGEPAQYLQITSPGLSITLQGKAAPTAPSMPSSTQFSSIGQCSAQGLLHAIQQVQYAVGTNLSWTLPEGVLLRICGSQARFNGTDGFRLANTQLLLDEPTPQEQELIIGPKDLSIIESLLDGAFARVAMMLSPSRDIFMLHTDVATFACLRVDGQYPDLKRLEPVGPHTSAEISAQPIREGLQLVECLGGLLKGRLSLEFTPGSASAPGRVMLNAVTEGGDAVSGVYEGNVQGQEHTYWLNGQYLKQTLDAVRSEHILLEVAEYPGRLILRPVGFPNDWHLIMLMKSPE